MKTTYKISDLELNPLAAEAGITRARTIEFSPEYKIIYLVVDPEKENPEVINHETKDFWLLYKTPPKKLINDLPTTS